MEVGCYSCGEPTRRRCRECRAPYCTQHGDLVCDACRARAEEAAARLPVSFLFSPLLFRAAVVLVVVGIVLGVVPDVLARFTADGQPAIGTPGGAPVTKPGGASMVTATPSPTVVPTATPTAPPPTTTPTPTSTPEGPVIIRYTVQSGDDLRSIAARFDVSAAAIVAYNGITDADTIHPGQVILIPK